MRRVWRVPITIVSGGDTNIVGAKVNANKVVADVGGNLKLESVQDMSKSAAHLAH